MAEHLFWIYLVNAVLIVNHEIDSAYWREWELFRLQGGITGFLVVHFPILFLIFYGMIEVFKNTFVGLLFSLLLSLAGFFAFVIHIFFIRKGRREFNTPVSIFILSATLIVSVIQFVVTMKLLYS
jgi:hypothetical protein